MEAKSRHIDRYKPQWLELETVSLQQFINWRIPLLKEELKFMTDSCHWTGGWGVKGNIKLITYTLSIKN